MSNQNNNKHNINLEKQSKTFLPRAVGLAWVLASKYSSRQSSLIFWFFVVGCAA